MEKENKYYIFGGQYESICYGGFSSLAEARKFAKNHREYWDNWQGWATPEIYKADDTEVIKSYGKISSPDGSEIRVPKAFTEPIE